ncbi:MAG: GIY-YIG nuclease family protein [Patescibacteria group bacterium]|nr:GIY-YIG nuclease family protein [Patescibacteria group bacterium]MDD5534526.1 GIY-YIG nuclease family protein [Patescibacteria group bacterium]
MYYVYILQSLKDNKFYIGCTSNLQRRFNEHQRGKDWATKFRRPWKLVYHEEYSDKNEAYKREYFLKSTKGYLEKKRITNRFLNDAG